MPSGCRSPPVCPREFGGKSDNLSHLGTSVIYLIAADSTPEPAWQAVIDAGANGKIAVAQAKAIIAAHKPPQPPATQPPADTELVRKHDYKFLHHPLPPYGDNSTETKWFQLFLGRFPVCFLNRRLALRGRLPRQLPRMRPLPVMKAQAHPADTKRRHGYQQRRWSWSDVARKVAP